MNYTMTTEVPPSAEELARLFAQVPWARDRSVVEIATMLQNTRVQVVVRDNGKLIGYGRAVSDGVFRALLDDVIVDEAYRGQGTGARIVRQLLAELPGVDEVFLNTGSHLEEFYRQFGFEKFKGLTMKASSPGSPVAGVDSPQST